MESIAQLNAALAGRYSVDRVIGSGGMATVFLAQDLRHARRVAVKVLAPELRAAIGVERFLSEIRVTANLHHPHLLSLFDSGEADDLLFYVMPYVEGESLRTRLNRERQLPVDEAVRIAVGVASGLDYAHRRGVVHRDLKPENILLHDGQPMIADFGIALALSKASSDRVTQTGLAVGTPQYASPEQATGDRLIDGRTDIYSLGTVMYEMLAGAPPHAAATTQAMIAKVVTDRAINVRALRPSVPVHVAEAVDRALEKLPADRFANPQEFADALRGRWGSAVSLVLTPTERDAIDGRVFRKRLRDPVLLVAAGAALAIGALGAWGLTGPARSVLDAPVRIPLVFDPDESLGSGASGSPLAVTRTDDGEDLVAYTSRRGAARPRIMLRPMRESAARPLPDTDDALYPAFSPDSRWIVFLAPKNQLKKLKVDGSSATPLTTVAAFGIAWASPGAIVVGQENGALLKVPSNGGPPVAFTALDAATGETSQRWPVAIDHGNTILYTSWRPDGPHVGVTSLRDGKCKLVPVTGTPLGLVDEMLVYLNTLGQVMAARFNVRRATIQSPMLVEQSQTSVAGAAKAALSAAGTLVYQVVDTTLMEIVQVDADGRSRAVPIERHAFRDLRISPEGTRVALTLTSAANTPNIHLYDLAGGDLGAFTTDGGSRPEWTRDGRILYVRGASGGDLWIRSADRRGAGERLLPRSASPAQGLLTRDGTTIVYRTDSESEDGPSIWYRALRGDTTRTLFAGGKNDRSTTTAPALSLDERILAYVSDESESGSYEVYVKPFPGTSSYCLVSDKGGTEPVWSRDPAQPNLLYYRHGRQLLSVVVGLSPGCSVRDRKVVYEGGLVADDYHRQYDVSPDGKFLLILREYQHNSGVEVVHNWGNELRARVAKAR
jgi:tRNA A-37 threonylcarbamoyl transferase component Bud32